MQNAYLTLGGKLVSAKFNRLTHRTPKPMSLTMAVTYRCQSRCQICRTWQFYQKHPNSAREELLPQDYLPLFESLKNDLVHLGLTGGEPFLKDQLVELISYAARKLKKLRWISIGTNGFESKKIIDMTTKILNIYSHRLSIEISLDGQEKIHDQIRGVKGGYKKALEAYRELQKIAQTNPRLNIFFSYTISPLNAGNFGAFFRNIHEDLGIGIERFSINFTGRGFFYHQDRSFALDKLDGKKLVKDVEFIIKQNQRAIKTNFFSTGKSLFQRFYVKNIPLFLQNPSKMILPCSAVSETFFLDPYGNLYPCLTWEKKLGNIKNLAFDKFWSSPNLKKIREDVRKGRCPVCFIPCVFQFSFLNKLPFSLFAR